MKGSSPLWRFMCVSKFLLFFNFAEHIVHENVLSWGSLGDLLTIMPKCRAKMLFSLKAEELFPLITTLPLTDGSSFMTPWSVPFCLIILGRETGGVGFGGTTGCCVW